MAVHTRIPGLKDNAYIVSGAFSGIGKATAEFLMQQKAKVVAVGRNANGVLPSYLGNYLPVVRNLKTDADCEEVIEFALDKFGQIDGVINCAGSLVAGTTRQLRRSDFERMLTDNFYTALGLTQHALPFMVRRERGVLMFLECEFGPGAPKGLAAFMASKMALKGYLESLRAELKDTALQVLEVKLQPFESLLWQNIQPEFRPPLHGEAFGVAEALRRALQGGADAELRPTLPLQAAA